MRSEKDAHLTDRWLDFESISMDKIRIVRREVVKRIDIVCGLLAWLALPCTGRLF